ncbi:glutamine-dependent NAD(+) synthetase [Patellaria atrata CBS 101060]|uniref:Glutamine-dependent NAD(+) synthetase n=1 Tax=Patellaria atrata CBS 101060 TaxID=1346257 RepID=A0A9P4SGX2_9PEZI|nr:glutamine-dependent NAD(+) synthetase [Patellaria atrata CBS 101060]
MVQLVKLATCQLNQWVLDFEGNAARIIESIKHAKEQGATFRLGPELEITGYGCLDHFLENDTYDHSWDMIERIITHPNCQDILIDLGAPIMHKGLRLNCRVIVHNSKIVLVRPKLSLANDGNFREMRYFTPWPKGVLEDFYLPDVIRESTGQVKCEIGECVLRLQDTVLAPETCEELFTPNGPSIAQGLDGVEIFTNASGSHHSLRKLDQRLQLILEATRKSGGVYMYSNQCGGDGDRLYYDGCAMIVINGKIKAQGSQFSLKDVEVLTATVDLDEVRSYRFAPSRALQAVEQLRNGNSLKRIELLEYRLSRKSAVIDFSLKPSPTLEPRYHTPSEEIGMCGGAFLWDYLRRSRQAGYFIPLSGGIDSCATSVMVFNMCRMVLQAIDEGDKQVIADARRISGEAEDSDWLPKSPQELSNKIFHTCFMGSVNSSKETRSRAKELAANIGAYHIDLNIDSVVTALTTMFSAVTNFVPRFKLHGGTATENLALQNIQARLRMVIAYMFAQLLPSVRQRPGGGGLLVLGSANVDECLRGYLTKYDCSSADINPIGGISKTDLKGFIAYAQEHYDLPILEGFLSAVPTAELEPISETYVQSDEADMGMTYDELSQFGTLRKVHRLSGYGMWQALLHLWGDRLSPRQVYEKTRWFFWCWAANRHKMTVMTPALHMEQYSPDDNRYDLRPFVYPVFSWPWKKVEDALKVFESEEAKAKKTE